MPCSDPITPRYDAHRAAAVGLLCEALKIIHAADLSDQLSPDLARWSRVHDEFDRRRAAGDLSFTYDEFDPETGKRVRR